MVDELSEPWLAAMVRRMEVRSGRSTIERLREVVHALCEGRPVLRVEVFGSVARGEARAGSDVDLLVEFESNAKAGLFEMGELREALTEKLNCRVDLLSKLAVQASRNLYRREAILDNPILVYSLPGVSSSTSFRVNR